MSTPCLSFSATMARAGEVDWREDMFQQVKYSFLTYSIFRLRQMLDLMCVYFTSPLICQPSPFIFINYMILPRSDLYLPWPYFFNT
jgi:hypothetical protein